MDTQNNETEQSSEQKTHMSTDVLGVQLSSQSPIEEPKTPEQEQAEHAANLKKSIDNITELEHKIPRLPRARNIPTAVKYAGTLLQVMNMKLAMKGEISGDPNDVQLMLPKGLEHVNVQEEYKLIGEKKSLLSTSERNLISMLYNIYIMRALSIMASCAKENNDLVNSGGLVTRMAADVIKEETLDVSNIPLETITNIVDNKEAQHASDCAVHNMPDSPNGECNCK